MNQPTDFSVELDSHIYSIQAIKNAAYDYSGRAWITIEEIQDTHAVLVSLKLKPTQHENESIEADFKNHVLDHQVRIDVGMEFKIIREMIVAQAFEPCGNLDEVVEKLIK